MTLGEFAEELLAADFVAEATEAAVTRIADLLRHPDDLTNKYHLVKKKLATERASTDAQLKSAVESQLDDAQRGLDALALATSETMRVKSNLSSIDKLCADAQNTITNYEKIKKISRTHQNFVATKEMARQFQDLNNEVKRIRSFLEHDRSRLIGPHDNMLLVHYSLSQLASFRNTTLQNAESSDVLATLDNYFKKTYKLSEEFDDYLWEVARNTLEIVRKGHPGAIVRMIKIIEVEERLDEEAALAETALVDPTLPTTNKAPPRQIKSYRIKFFDVLREAIQRHLAQWTTAPKGEMPKLLQSAEVVVDDLILVYDELVPCFPRRYNIFQFFVLEYHRMIYETVNKVVGGPMEGGAILALLKWVRDYYDSMSGRLGVGEELLEPRLLDGREEELMLTYVKLVRAKLSEWLSNLQESETRDFLKRDVPPEVDANGMYVQAGSVIVFQMFNQQVDLVASSSRGPLLHDVVVECVNKLLEFQKSWMALLDGEFKKFESKSADLAEGLPEYAMALGNDCYRSTEFSETMSKKLEPMLDEPWKGKVAKKVKEGFDGFMKVAKRVYTVLIDISLMDCKPALVQLHCSSWYEQDMMRLVVGTLDDYCSDFQQHLTEYLFSKLMTDLLDKFIVAYVESFRNKGAKFRMPSATEKMRSDLAMCVEFFSRFKTAKKVKASFEVIEKLIGFVEANANMAYLDFYALWKAYPDVPMKFIEELLQKRDDLDKSQVREIMESCREKAEEEHREDVPPTVFSKINMK
ncbi:SNARE-binding exocyst subunit S6 [Quaeritorhiza haematococci]|nr:SNARE-binding exocyst subunit S6 [Quaeritorhiza haematococci]